ncbi:MAG TPA: hypothetical protein VN857_01440 [Chthoniobacterales bacterium]|jgi:hypothetical protein|nr:hypothetical protein [Chthoniobacterales bacterium]
MMRIVQGDLGDLRVVDLLHIHVTSARAETAPGSAHALDLPRCNRLTSAFGQSGTLKRSWGSAH